MFKLEEIIKAACAEIRKDFTGTEEEFNARLREKSTEILTGVSTIFMRGLFKFYEEKRIKEIQDGFAKFLQWNWDHYKDGLEMFLMYIDLTVTINTDVSKHFEVEKFSNLEKLKFGQLLHLHIKGCQIANEIYALINAGYADAALARWRTLHETTVVFNILFKNDPIVSQMFYDFQFIEKYKRVKTFEIHRKTLNWKAVDEVTIQSLQQKRTELITKYGADFAGDYGWAQKIVTKDKRHFAGLEEDAGLSYLRPFYQWANKGVHAGPEGTFSRLGFDDINIPRSYLAGPSRYGMVDPMQFTTYSLLKMTTMLLELVNTFENHLLVMVLDQLHNEIAEAMISAKDKLPM